MSNPRLCTSVAATTMEDLRRARDAAFHTADLVELRLDGVRDLDVAGALADRPGPVVIACRPAWEGGRYDGPEERRLSVLGDAVRGGAEFVEVEWRSAFQPVLALRAGRGVILALHDYDGVPEDLAGIYRAMRSAGAELVKIAVTAHQLCDVLPLRDLDDDRSSAAHVLVAMGLPGLATRVLAGRFGSRWACATNGTDPRAHSSAARLVEEFRFRSIGADTRVFGVVGNPVGHSLSPVMHNAAFEEIGHDAIYLPLQAASADDFVRFAAALGISGASVTAPFKRDLAARSVAVEGDLAGVIGAANTVKAEQGTWRSCNTDVPGFLAPLEARGLVLDGLRAAVVGAGGAARAVAFALASCGASVTIHGRQLARAEAAASVAPGATATDRLPAAGAWDLLVNATPVGMAPAIEETPVPPAALEGGGVVYDLTYTPQQTRLLADAVAAGCTTVGGLEMLVAQAARQFEWWTGRPAPVATMKAAAERRLAPADSERGR